MSNTYFQTDILIIGAGPAGLFTVFEAGMLKMRCDVVDTLDFLGGQCSALYPEKPIYDIPGHPHITGETLIHNLEKQAAPFNPRYHLGQQVVRLQKQGSSWQATTSKGTVIEARAIIIAAGCGAFGPNRPPLSRLSEFEGKSVFYLIKKKEDFRNKRIVIAGGGDSAVDWTLSLADIAQHIYVIHRRDKFKAAPGSVEKMHQLAKEKKITLVIPFQLDALEGKNGILSEVHVKSLDGGKRVLEADVLLPFYGLAMELGPIAEWGLQLDKSHIHVNPVNQQTSEPGIFAIGDIAHYPNKLKLILTGFAEAATACYASYPLVHPDEALHFEYSTTKGVPETV